MQYAALAGWRGILALPTFSVPFPKAEFEALKRSGTSEIVIFDSDLCFYAVYL